MKLELYGLIEPLLEAGGKFEVEDGRYALRNLKGYCHREDGPAIICPDGRQEWCRNGKYHRDDGPAVIYPNGEQLWYRDGNLHREDGPAVIHPNGEQYWYRNGKQHREGE